MAITLIINPGSSSKKYALFRDETTLATWHFERNEKKYELCTEYQGQQQKCEGIQFTDYTAALRQVLDAAEQAELISDRSDITAVALRVVAPGTMFQAHSVIDAAYTQALQRHAVAAPLHIPHTVQEIEQLTRELPQAKIVGVSDSAFHAQMPAVARTYGIASEDANRYDIHRFGYHGISCASVWRRAPSMLPATPRRCVIAHIGSGMSMTAVKDGQSIDTSMGFSPASGLIMGSRAGNIGSGALLELMRVRNFSYFDMQSYLSSQSGLQGLTGDADFRQILERIAHDDQAAKAALALVVYQFQKQLGAFSVALGGLDTVVLTATAMERSSDLRQQLLAGLEWFGITIDEDTNEALPRAGGMISAAQSRVSVAVIPTNEIDEMRRIATTVMAQS